MKQILTSLLKSYLKFVYYTTSWKYSMPSGYSLQEFDQETRTIFTFWHNRLALAPYIFTKHKDIYALVSPHSDGQIISNILMKMGYKIIEGSTHRNPLLATRKIIAALTRGSNIAITPDVPRGPKYKINSNIIGIAKIAKAKIIPLSFNIKYNIRFNSWDSFILPLPFGRGIVVVGDALILSDNDALSMQELESRLNQLSQNEA